MVRELSREGVKVPDGFATTAEAYRDFLAATGLDRTISEILAKLDTRDLAELQRRGLLVRQAMLAATVPAEIESAILAAYDRLADGARGGIDVAVRSSATAEDLPDASFAGQQETYLNVRGHAALLEACKRCFASLFTDRAISYRIDKGFDHAKLALSSGRCAPISEWPA